MLDIQTDSKTVTTTTIQFQSKDLLQLIRISNPDIGRLLDNSRAKVRVFLTVPAGGDYSNMELEIDHLCPILVEIITPD